MSVGPRHILLLSNYSLITQTANTIFVYHCILNELFNVINLISYLNIVNYPTKLNCINRKLET